MPFGSLLATVPCAETFTWTGKKHAVIGPRETPGTPRRIRRGNLWRIEMKLATGAIESAHPGEPFCTRTREPYGWSLMFAVFRRRLIVDVILRETERR